MFPLLLLLCVGCRTKPATQVLVNAHAEQDLAARARAIEVRVYTAGEDPGEYTERRELSDDVTLPVTVPVLPAQGDATRRFVAEADLLDEADAVIATVRAESGFVEDELTEIWLVFADACADLVGCGPRESCRDVDGLPVCESACVDPLPLDEGPRPSVSVSCPDAPECDCPCADDTCVSGRCVPARPAAFVGLGDAHACAIDEAGLLYCWGENQDRQLGLGTLGAPVPTPTRVEIAYEGGPGETIEVPFDDVAEVDPSTNFTCARRTDGRVYCWGDHDNRRLGLGACCVPENIEQDRPRVHDDDRRLQAVATGSSHGCGVSATNAGRMLCWGDNRLRQVSDLRSDLRDQYASPVTVGLDDDWLEITSGIAFNCAIRSAGPGGLYCWGDSRNLRLGRGYMNEPVGRPTRILNEQSFVTVSAGGRTACAISFEGELYCWGANPEGQAGQGDVSFSATAGQVLGEHIDWVDVSVGLEHVCAVRDRGRLFCWGSNLRGQLGAPTQEPVVPSPVPVTFGVRSVDVGQGFTCAIRDDGRLFCWGANGAGQLGVGDFDARDVPTRVCL